MTVMTPKEHWTDPRLDDLKEHMDEGFRELKSELRQQREEMIHMARQENMESRFNDLNRTVQIVFSVLGAVLAANTTLLVCIIGLLIT